MRPATWPCCEIATCPKMSRAWRTWKNWCGRSRKAWKQGETFTDFLDAAALVSDADSFEGKPGVTLITLHSTKGLEFDHVFLTGLEEGIAPAQPLAERRKRDRRRTTPGLRRHDARAQFAHAYREPSTAASSATNSRCVRRCLRAFWEKFPANWWKRCAARWPRSANRAATNPTRSIPIPRMNF